MTRPVTNGPRSVPREAFGTPAEFAAAAAAELPAQLRAEVDRQGLTAADHLTGGLFHLAALVLLASVFFAILDGTLSFPVTPAVLTGVPLLALGMLAAGSAPRRARPAPPVPDGDREAWLTRLTGLLIGRYDLPAGRAAELTRKARAHLDATGAAPADEFGPLADYARRLAEHEPVRREPWWRSTPATMVSLAIGVYLGVSAFLTWSDDGHRWAAYLIALPTTAALGWQLITTARGYRR